MHGVNDVRKTEMHILERLMTEPSAYYIEEVIEKLKT
jgi:hypothetical protein